eukprot:scaffold7744_cov90-Cylindrotheca_fusiformis.AAC.6
MPALKTNLLPHYSSSLDPPGRGNSISFQRMKQPLHPCASAWDRDIVWKIERAECDRQVCARAQEQYQEQTR